MVRDNEMWQVHLKNGSSVQQTALSDLREILVRNLRHAILSSSSVDETFLEDAVQDSLILILERLYQFEGRSKFLTWATSIAIRVAMSKLRRQRWKDVSLDDVISDSDFSPEVITDENPGPEIQFERKSIINRMYSIIQKDLTEKQKTALFAELKGMPLDEIASQLGINRNAVYKLTHDARKRLKSGLETAGYCATDIDETFTV